MTTDTGSFKNYLGATSIHTSHILLSSFCTGRPIPQPWYQSADTTGTGRSVYFRSIGTGRSIYCGNF